MLDPTLNPNTVIDESNAHDYRYGLTEGGGFFIRPMWVKAGESHKGHDHDIDHVGNLVSGHAIVHLRHPETGQECVVDMRVPCKIKVHAKWWHRIDAVTDVEWECWFAAAEARDLVEPARSRYYFEREGADG